MKHKPTKQWELLKIENGKIKKIREHCPRCGETTYMAEHKEKDGKTRKYCGKCKYTIWENLKQ